MTFLELRNRAARRFFDPDKIRVVDDDWKDYINDAYHTFVTQMPFPFEETVLTVTTASGTREVTIAADTYAVLSVYNTTDDRILYPVMNREQLLRLWEGDTEDGAPRHFNVVGNELHLYPTPDAAYDLEIFAHVAPDPLDADNDVPVIPHRYHNALVAFALAQAYSDQGDVEHVELFTAEFGDALRRAVKELSLPRGGRYPTITDTFYHDERWW